MLAHCWPGGGWAIPHCAGLGGPMGGLGFGPRQGKSRSRSISVTGCVCTAGELAGGGVAAATAGADLLGFWGANVGDAEATWVPSVGCPKNGTPELPASPGC